MQQVTRTTPLRLLPPRVIREISNRLDIGDAWKELAVLIKNRAGQLKFTQRDLWLFESRMHKGGCSATELVLQACITDNSNLGMLMQVLSEAQLYVVVDYLCEEILKEDPPQKDHMGDTDIVSSTVSTAELPAPPKLPPSGKVLEEKILNCEKCEQQHISYQSECLQSSCKASNISKENMSDETKLFTRCNEPVENADCDTVIIPRITSETPQADNCGICFSPGNLLIFTYEQLEVFTNSFNERSARQGGNLVGCGGFGNVFRGVCNGKKIAVKQFKRNLNFSGEGLLKQFTTEIRVLSKYQHENLLPIFGYSNDGPCKCIVYEYMPNGSVEDRLLCEGGTPSLTMRQRVVIAKGTAKGISYLHTSGEHPVIHRDIKSANILLDTDFKAKVGDFGLVRRGPTNPGSTSTQTDCIIGTSAYIPPEYMSGVVSIKMDTYSYGVVLLELLTGLPAYDAERKEKCLRDHVDEYCEDIMNMVDHRAGNWSESVANTMYAMSERCLETKKRRPTVTEVLDEIQGWEES